MPEFNPYREWLGLEGVIGSPNYYVLLGLSPSVQDGEEIRQAADRAMGRVRSQRPGANGQAWAALIDRLGAAKSCLLDASQRAEYDRQLAGPSAPRVPMSAPPGAAAPSSYNYPPGMGGPPSQPSAPTPAPFPAAGPLSGYPPTAAPYPQPWQQTAAPMAAAPWPTAAPNPTPGYSPPGYPGPGPAPSPYPGYPAPAYPAPAGYPSAPAADPWGGGSVPMAMPVAAPGGWPGPAPDPWNAQPAPAYPQPAANPWGGAPASAMPAAAMPAAYAGWPTSPYSPQPGMAPAPSPSAVPAAMPYDPFAGAPGAPAYGGGDPGYAASPAMTATAEIPRGTAVAPAAPLASEPAAMVDDIPRGPEIKSRESTGAPVERDRGESNQFLIWGGVAAAGLICVLIAIAAMPRDNGKPLAGPHRPTDPGPRNVTPRPNPNERPRPRPMPGDPKKPANEDPEGPDEMPADPKTPALLPSPAPMPMPEPGPKPPSDPTMPVTPSPKPPMPAPMPEPPMPMPKPPVIQPTSAELAELKQALTTARQAMAERELDASATALAKAEKVAKLPEHREMLERLKALHASLTEFWNAVGEGAKSLKATDELTVGSTMVAVVEVGADFLIVRVAGNNRRYRLTGLPHGLAMSVADRWFDKNAPSTSAIRASYLAIDKGGDRDEAKQLWQQAADKGVKVGDIALVLDDNYDKLAGGPAPMPAPMPEPMPKPPTDPKPGPSEVSVADKSAVIKALIVARKALSERKVDVAKRELTRIQSTPKSPEHTAQLARLEKLTANVEDFWKTFGEALKKVKAGNDIIVKGMPISLVEVGPDLLIIRAAGQNQRYKTLEIPGLIVVALAEEHLDMSLPLNRLLLGSFYAVEQRKETGTPDDALARGLWEDAGRGGIDVADLLPVLDDKYGSP